MKTERRHELQTNALADALGQAVDTVKPYSQIVLGGILAVLVVLGVVKYLSIRSQEDVVDAWNRYLQASSASGTESIEELTRLIQQYPESTAAHWAHLSLADQSLGEGISQLFQNRAEAKDKLRKAEEHYLAVQQKAKEPLLLERATLGLARTYESLPNLEKAQQEYQRLLENWPKGAYTLAAKERLAHLSQKSTKEFYDWFVANEPKSAVDGGLGTPGSRPSFNLDDPSLDNLPLNLNPSALPPASVDPEKTSQDSKPDSEISAEPVSTAKREPAGEPKSNEESSKP